MTDEPGRYRSKRTPPHGYPVAKQSGQRVDGSPVSFVDESTGVHSLPDGIRDPIAHAVDSALRSYHARVEPSRNELTSIHQLQARTHALLEDFALPVLKDLQRRIDKIEMGQVDAANKQQMFIEAEWNPAKANINKIPGLVSQVETLREDLDEVIAQAGLHREDIDALKRHNEEQRRKVENFTLATTSEKLGEQRIVKRHKYMLMSAATAVGFVISHFGKSILKLIKEAL